MALALAAVLARSAAAHAVLQHSSPADRAVVKRAPAVVRFFYDDPVEPAPGIAAIRNDGGSVLVSDHSGEHSRKPSVPAIHNYRLSDDRRPLRY